MFSHTIFFSVIVNAMIFVSRNVNNRIEKNKRRLWEKPHIVRRIQWQFTTIFGINHCRRINGGFRGPLVIKWIHEHKISSKFHCFLPNYYWKNWNGWKHISGTEKYWTVLESLKSELLFSTSESKARKTREPRWESNL